MVLKKIKEAWREWGLRKNISFRILALSPQNISTRPCFRVNSNGLVNWSNVTARNMLIPRVPSGFSCFKLYDGSM
jgi:hypothetical protein